MTQDTQDFLTQESIDKLDETIREYMSQYQSGILMLDEFLRAVDSLYLSYPQGSLVGLIDPPTGLKYHPVPKFGI